MDVVAIMLKLSFHKVSKLLVCFCLFYLFFFKYAYRNMAIVLYGTAGLAFMCLAMDLLVLHRDIKSTFHWGILVHPLMCIYSLIIGIFVAQNQNILISAIKTYMAFSMVCMVICYVSKEEKSINWLTNTICQFPFTVAMLMKIV